jgi:hypothetical protein
MRNRPHLDPGIVELVGIRRFAVEPAHIFGRRRPIHQLADLLGEHALLTVQLEIHRSISPSIGPSINFAS